MIKNTKLEVVDQVAKASPPVAVGALTLSGITLSDLVLWATLFYTVFQIGLLFRDRVWRDYKWRYKDDKDSFRKGDEGTSQNSGEKDEGVD